MSCKPVFKRPSRHKSTGCSTPKQKSSKIHSSRFREFNLHDLSEKGRIKFFFHCPDSKLPVRDILNKQGKGVKTEPHIEKNAENYCNKCYQPNVIIPFLRSDEKYLFLFTTCKNEKMKKYYNRQFIVGYITKENALFRTDHWAVQGKTFIYSFSDAYPLITKANPRHQKRKKAEKETSKILDHFESKTNILPICIKELINLKHKKSIQKPLTSC